MMRLLRGFADELVKLGYDLSPSTLNRMHKTLVKANKEFAKVTKDVSSSVLQTFGVGGEKAEPVQGAPMAQEAPEVGKVVE